MLPPFALQEDASETHFIGLLRGLSEIEQRSVTCNTGILITSSLFHSPCPSCLFPGTSFQMKSPQVSLCLRLCSGLYGDGGGSRLDKYYGEVLKPSGPLCCSSYCSTGWRFPALQYRKGRTHSGFLTMRKPVLAFT